jgi:hypothetical protein
MASSCKKRRFRDLQSVERSIDNVRNAIPRTTRYKNRWGVRIFEDWQSGRENKAVMCESNPFSLDLQNLQNLETELCSMTARTLIKLLAYQICSRSLRQGWQAISRAYSIPNYMLARRNDIYRRKWPG